MLRQPLISKNLVQFKGGYGVSLIFFSLSLRKMDTQNGSRTFRLKTFRRRTLRRRTLRRTDILPYGQFAVRTFRREDTSP